jgi:Ras GTPase-activating-like protein IQGAP2/3
MPVPCIPHRSPPTNTCNTAHCGTGRDNAVLEMNLQLDDLLERQQMGVLVLDLEYVKLSVPRFLALLNKHFLKK